MLVLSRLTAKMRHMLRKFIFTESNSRSGAHERCNSTASGIVTDGDTTTDVIEYINGLYSCVPSKVASEASNTRTQIRSAIVRDNLVANAILRTDLRAASGSAFALLTPATSNNATTTAVASGNEVTRRSGLPVRGTDMRAMQSAKKSATATLGTALFKSILADPDYRTKIDKRISFRSPRTPFANACRSSLSVLS